MRHVVSLLSDGNRAPDVSLTDFSWSGNGDAERLTDEQLANVVRVNSFDLFGSSALFGANLCKTQSHSLCSLALFDAL